MIEAILIVMKPRPFRHGGTLLQPAGRRHKEGRDGKEPRFVLPAKSFSSAARLAPAADPHYLFTRASVACRDPKQPSKDGSHLSVAMAAP